MTDSLYSEVTGQGENVVLLHGWGMHGGLWGSFNKILSNGFMTHAIDLPGFGYSKSFSSDFTLDAITEVVEEYIQRIGQPVSLIGWSLGGLITLNILKRNNINLNKIILIAATPCFTKKTGWLNAIDQSVFDDFSTDLQNDYKKTLKRFLSLQTRGSELARDDLRVLHNTLTERGDPDIQALKNGLNILSETDLRDITGNNIPAMIVLGEKDTLVPLPVKDEFEKIFPDSEKLILEKTGHAPFISKPEVCAIKIKNFING